MHCPICGCQQFSVLLDFSTTNVNYEQILTADDYVTCQGCDKEFLMGELVADMGNDNA